jgi:hypothetical protein
MINSPRVRKDRVRTRRRGVVPNAQRPRRRRTRESGGARKHETRCANSRCLCPFSCRSERKRDERNSLHTMSGGDRGASSRGASNSSSGGGGGAAATRGGSGGSASSAGGVGHHGGGAPRGSAAASGAAGRERAIETILDRDPRGCYYRAARVVVRDALELSAPAWLMFLSFLLTRFPFFYEFVYRKSWFLSSLPVVPTLLLSQLWWSRPGA